MNPFSGRLAGGELTLASGGHSVADGLLLALDGAVYNLAALGRELGVEPDPALVLSRGYRRWGAALAPRLRGEFALLLWDPRGGHGLLVPDQLGVHRVAVRRVGSRLWFATEVRDLLAMLPSRPAPDPLAVARWLTARPAAARATLYAGVECPGPGEMVELTRDGGAVRRYWQPRYREPLELPRGEWTEQVGAALELAVARRTATAAPVGVMMSGGLDSTSVAVLAQAAAPGGACAFSVTFPDYPRVDESDWIEALEAETGLPGVHLAAEPAGILASGIEYLRTWELPLHAWNEAWTQPLLREANAMGVATMLTGEGGDELFGSRLLLTADLLRGGHPLAALRFARGLPEGGGRLPRRLLADVMLRFGLAGLPSARLEGSWRRFAARRARGPWWASDGLVRLLHEGPDEPSWRLPGVPRWWAFLVNVLTEGVHAFGILDHLRRRTEQAGLEARHPLLDLDLFELMLRVPPALCSEGSLTRPLLRDAMAGLSPDAVRLRPGKSVFDEPVDDALSGPELPALRQLLGNSSEVRAYARGAAIEEMLAKPPQQQRGGAGAWGETVLRLTAIELWLRYQADRELPQRLLADPLVPRPSYRVETAKPTAAGRIAN